MSLPITSHTPEPYVTLIDSAETWYEQGHYKEAVILAQTALEIFTEKMLGHLYQTRRIEYLKGQFEHLLINYNIGNSKVSGLYMALSGDKITQEPFWSAITDHVELRNRLVHDGEDATESQAHASLKAVKAMMEHVKQYNHVD